MDTATGKDIVIEQRAANEVVRLRAPVVRADAIDTSHIETVQVAASGINVWNPAFDVTPAHLIDAIITEKGVVIKSNGKFNFERLMQTAPSSPLAASSSPPSPFSLSSPHTSGSVFRKKKKRTGDPLTIPFTSTYPLARFFEPFADASLRAFTLPIIILTTTLFKVAVGFGPYSGWQNPPMHGDFEAQRHWMELTSSLKIEEWYFYDLEWWGLDYPPLTAYHSWFIGSLGKFIQPQWFALNTSRGLDDEGLKTFMRMSVIVSELVCYVPAVISFCRIWGGRQNLNRVEQALAFTLILFQPALILIDHGHFQYNSVMLGFSLLCINDLLRDSVYTAAMWFVFALGYKQMALYYALPIFAYLLGYCVFPRRRLHVFMGLASVVIICSGMLLWPFWYAGGVGQILQCGHRIFPFARGLYEDKVANVWCAMNVFFKLRKNLSLPVLQLLSAIATLFSVLPVCTVLFFYPQKKLLPIALSASAWGFFLFSFQVHEKSVLLPLMPMTLLLCGSDRDERAWIGWTNNVAVFSMWPLLRRDGLTLQYIAMTGFWNWVGEMYHLPGSILGKTIHLAVYLAMAGWHVGQATIKMHEKYPDFWVVINVEICCAAFGLVWLWCLLKMYKSVRSPI